MQVNRIVARLFDGILDAFALRRLRNILRYIGGNDKERNGDIEQILNRVPGLNSSNLHGSFNGFLLFRKGGEKTEHHGNRDRNILRDMKKVHGAQYCTHIRSFHKKASCKIGQKKQVKKIKEGKEDA